MLTALGCALSLGCGNARTEANRQANTQTNKQESRAETRPAPSPKQPVQFEAAPVVDDGLQPIDGPGLLAHIKQSGRKATLVNVWASWCGSCKRELPMLLDLGKSLEVEGINVVFVSVDKPAERPAAAALLQTFEPRPTSFINKGLLGPFKRALNPGWKGALPATALLDKNAELLWFWPGPVVEHEIAAIVSQFLAGQTLEGPTLVEPDPPPQ